MQRCVACGADIHEAASVCLSCGQPQGAVQDSTDPQLESAEESAVGRSWIAWRPDVDVEQRSFPLGIKYGFLFGSGAWIVFTVIGMATAESLIACLVSFLCFPIVGAITASLGYCLEMFLLIWRFLAGDQKLPHLPLQTWDRARIAGRNKASVTPEPDPRTSPTGVTEPPDDDKTPRVRQRITSASAPPPNALRHHQRYTPAPATRDWVTFLGILVLTGYVSQRMSEDPHILELFRGSCCVGFPLAFFISALAARRRSARSSSSS
jgi:hypothetical protein